MAKSKRWKKKGQMRKQGSKGERRYGEREEEEYKGIDQR